MNSSKKSTIPRVVAAVLVKLKLPWASPIGVETSTADQPATIRFWRNVTPGAAPDTATMTLLGSEDIIVPAIPDPALLTFPLSTPVCVSEELVVELFTPDGAAIPALFFIGSNNSAETTPSYLLAVDCGVAVVDCRYLQSLSLAL